MPILEARNWLGEYVREWYLQVKWVRLLYKDFSAFAEDQVHLIKSADAMGKKKKPNKEMRYFDYVEGSLISDTSILNNWRSSFFSTDDHAKITSLAANNSTVYCLEAAKYYDRSTADIIEQVQLQSNLLYIYIDIYIYTYVYHIYIYIYIYT